MLRHRQECLCHTSLGIFCILFQSWPDTNPFMKWVTTICDEVVARWLTSPLPVGNQDLQRAKRLVRARRRPACRPGRRVFRAADANWHVRSALFPVVRLRLGKAL